MFVGNASCDDFVSVLLLGWYFVCLGWFWLFVYWLVCLVGCCEWFCFLFGFGCLFWLVLLCLIVLSWLFGCLVVVLLGVLCYLWGLVNVTWLIWADFALVFCFDYYLVIVCVSFGYITCRVAVLLCCCLFIGMLYCVLMCYCLVVWCLLCCLDLLWL